MCSHDYHHNGFMATPALGTQDVRFYRDVAIPHNYNKYKEEALWLSLACGLADAKKSS